MAFRIQWRGRRLKIRIDAAGKFLHAALEAGDPMPVVVVGRQYELRRDGGVVCPL
jgi:trehalose/maltose hydrolase-like predicted phosphorylase